VGLVLLQATEGLGFEARIQAVQDATSDAIASLAARLAAAVEEDRAAKEKRRDLIAHLTTCRGSILARSVLANNLLRFETLLLSLSFNPCV
jgi:hypothetical protein